MHMIKPRRIVTGNNNDGESEIKINRFKLDLNSRELFLSNQKLKLTEKEIL